MKCCYGPMGRYPNGFHPNDDLDQLTLELMDWNGDQPHSSFRSLTTELREAGYYVETLHGDWTTFNSSLYGASPRLTCVPHKV